MLLVLESASFSLIRFKISNVQTWPLILGKHRFVLIATHCAVLDICDPKQQSLLIPLHFPLAETRETVFRGETRSSTEEATGLRATHRILQIFFGFLEPWPSTQGTLLANLQIQEQLIQQKKSGFYVVQSFHRSCLQYLVLRQLNWIRLQRWKFFDVFQVKHKDGRKWGVRTTRGLL